MNRTDRNHSNLDKKLGAYALAGAAMLAAPITVKAEIQYVAVNQTFTSADATSGYFLGDPDSPTFGIGALPGGEASSGPSVVAVAEGAGGVLADGSSSLNIPLAAALPFGALIDPTDTANFGKAALLADSNTTDSTHWSLTGGDAYLGFAIPDADGDLVAGWVHIATTANDDTSSFTVIDYAFETDPNTVITAGEGTPTPEPSSLALLALGGAGLLAYRHRRAARV